MVLHGPLLFYVDTSLDTTLALFLPEGECYRTVTDLLVQATCAHRELFPECGEVEAAQLCVYGAELHRYGCQLARRYALPPSYDAVVLEEEEHIFVALKRLTASQALALRPKAVTAPTVLANGGDVPIEVAEMDESMEQLENRVAIRAQVVDSGYEEGSRNEESKGRQSEQVNSWEGTAVGKGHRGEQSEKGVVKSPEKNEDVSVVEDSLIEEAEDEEGQQEVMGQMKKSVHGVPEEVVEGSLVDATLVAKDSEGVGDAGVGGLKTLNKVVMVSPPRSTQPANALAKEAAFVEATTLVVSQDKDGNGRGETPRVTLSSPIRRKGAKLDGVEMGEAEVGVAIPSSQSKKPTYKSTLEEKPKIGDTVDSSQPAVSNTVKSGPKLAKQLAVRTPQNGVTGERRPAPPGKQQRQRIAKSKPQKATEDKIADKSMAAVIVEENAVLGVAPQSSPSKQANKDYLISDGNDIEVDDSSPGKKAYLGVEDAVEGTVVKSTHGRQPPKSCPKARTNKRTGTNAAMARAVIEAEPPSTPGKQPKKRGRQLIVEDESEGKEIVREMNGTAIEPEGNVLVASRQGPSFEKKAERVHANEILTEADAEGQILSKPSKKQISKDKAGMDTEKAEEYLHSDPFAFPHSPPPNTEESQAEVEQATQHYTPKMASKTTTPEAKCREASAVMSKPKDVPKVIRALSDYKAAHPLLTTTKRRKVAPVYQFYDY